MALSVFINISLIIVFKYANFLADGVIEIFKICGVSISRVPWDITLPIGISFYTFHAISYVVDVYRKQIEPNRSFILFCNYVIFFPQLVAGPILRAGEMIWQLQQRPKFESRFISNGFLRIIAGLFLKVVLADNLAPFVDEAYAVNPAGLFLLDTLTLGFIFGFQIYFDFSGYSHIAIGVAQLMGIRFPENFDYPYLSLNPRMFWRRWHISLSSWIRDYIYLPLAGVKVVERNSTGGIGIDGTGQVGKNSVILALFTTWIIMGLWHGAAWTFAVWGLWHAILVQGHRWIQPYVSKVNSIFFNVIGWGLTLVLVMLGWIPFRAPTLEYTITVWKNLGKIRDFNRLGLREVIYLVAALTLVLTVLAPFGWRFIGNSLKRYPVVSESFIIVGLILALTLIVVYLRPVNQFIYFQF